MSSQHRQSVMPLPLEPSLTPHQHACLYRQRTPSKSHNACLQSSYRTSPSQILFHALWALLLRHHYLISFSTRSHFPTNMTWLTRAAKIRFYKFISLPKDPENHISRFGYIRKVIFSTKTKACLSLKGWTRRQRAFCSHKVRDGKLSHYAEKRVDQNQTLLARGWPVAALSIYQCWSNALKTGRWKTNLPLQGEKEPS